MFRSPPTPPDLKFTEFARLSLIKNALYEAQRREHTERVRQELIEQRQYELFWEWEFCGWNRQWTAKHG